MSIIPKINTQHSALWQRSKGHAEFKYDNCLGCSRH